MVVATFILLTDPQQGDAYTPADQKISYESALNRSLNKLGKGNDTYPANFNLSPAIVDEPIKPGSIFFAGDLTQFGGLVNRGEQANLIQYDPSNYVGGSKLQDHRALYDLKYPRDGVDQPLFPLYFGLGNHDLPNGDAALGWRFFKNTYSTSSNHYRYQMWNFIAQMHTGHTRGAGESARFHIPSDQIDADPDGTYEWDKYSFNYFIDLGPVDVYQLHVHGGHAEHDRKSGLQWLRHKLAVRGYRRPVIIVQHYMLSDPTFGDFWTWGGRNQLLEVLLPYNIIAFCVGHNHGVGPIRPNANVIVFPNGRGTLPSGSNKKTIVPEIRPGAAYAKHFALLRVEVPDGAVAGTLDVLYGDSVGDNGISWTGGWSAWSDGQDIPSPPPVVFTYPPPLYVKELEVVVLDDEGENSPLLPTQCTEMSGQSCDVNRGFDGKYVYIRPLLTYDPNDAITTVEITVTKSKDSSKTDLATGAGGKYRYLTTSKDSSKGQSITGVFFLRSSSPQTGYPNMTGISTDINQGRGGSYLYLVWRTWT